MAIMAPAVVHDLVGQLPLGCPCMLKQRPEYLFTQGRKTLSIMSIFTKDATLRIRYNLYVLVPGGVTKASVLGSAVC